VFLGFFFTFCYVLLLDNFIFYKIIEFPFAVILGSTQSMLVVGCCCWSGCCCYLFIM